MSHQCAAAHRLQITELDYGHFTPYLPTFTIILALDTVWPESLAMSLIKHEIKENLMFSDKAENIQT